jgi:signal peptidase I
MKTKKDKFWIIVLIVVVLVILLRVFVFEFVNLAGESMVPTLRDGQLIGIYKVNYVPERGDIVVLDAPNGIELIKRVIGLPGETLEIKEGITYIDGTALEQKI